MRRNSVGGRLVVLAALLLVSSQNGLGDEPQAAEEPLTYERHIRPIFRVHCFDCHGATAEMQGGLDLRLVRFLTKGGESGPAIEPGRAADSFLLQRVRDGEMPPEGQVSPEEIALLERWINQGAKTARAEPESIGPGLGVTPEERQYWAFQPVTRPELPDVKWPPEVKSKGAVRNPIDAFLLAQMPEGLTFCSEADRPTLIKRLYFDLLGLPPSSAEMKRWLSEGDGEGDGWYERLIDELLESPHYGERWGRHWLDVAGYADSEGYTAADSDRPWAWKYRDYVVRSIHADKPFDRFIVEQLAGDELAGPKQGDWTPEQIDLLTATGYLRMAPDGTGSGANDANGRNKVVTDTIRIVSSSLLSVSVACAQCHDHRYDPIPQTDYYAMRAIFEPALDWNQWQVPNQRRVSLYTEADRKRAAEVEAEAQVVAKEKATKQAIFMKQALEKELEKYESPLKETLKEAYETAGDKRTDEQKKLLKQYPSVNISPGVLYQYLPKAAEELKTFDKKIADIRVKKPEEQFLRVLAEPAGRNVQTKLFYRGEHQNPKQVVGPAALSVIGPLDNPHVFAADEAALPTTGRRSSYGKWLTDGMHPLVTRSLVNRFWMHHFGRGIVATPSDFGKLGTEPSHAELLDWLAAEFVSKGWSLKQFHRTILTSAAWRQSSLADEQHLKLDPNNRFYSRWSVRRAEAETVRDRILAVTEQLDRTVGGRPIAIKEDDTGQVIVDGASKRRSLYIRVRRSQPVAMLQAFDAPTMADVNCEKRPSSTVATQSLMLMNSQFILEQANHLAALIAVADSVPADDPLLAGLPPLPLDGQSPWQYGYGSFAAEGGTQFTALPHWAGSAWQGGEKLPDPKLSWVIVNRNGGHTGSGLQMASIRRLVLPGPGTVTVTGTFSHGSENGDGVHGQLVVAGKLQGEWDIHNGSTETKTEAIAVAAGQTIDLVVSPRENVTSDSYTWPVKVEWKSDDGRQRSFDSSTGFQGPSDRVEELPSQIIRAWELALSRKPTKEELKLALEFANEQLSYLADHPDKLPKDVTPIRQVVVNLSHVLMTSNEFLYVD